MSGKNDELDEKLFEELADENRGLEYQIHNVSPHERQVMSEAQYLKEFIKGKGEDIDHIEDEMSIMDKGGRKDLSDLQVK